jgi:hypothetical protein
MQRLLEGAFAIRRCISAVYIACGLYSASIGDALRDASSEAVTKHYRTAPHLDGDGMRIAATQRKLHIKGRGRLLDDGGCPAYCDNSRRTKVVHKFMEVDSVMMLHG